MAASFDDITLETPVRFDFVIDQGLASTACDAIFLAMENHGSIESISASLNDAGDHSRLRVVSTVQGWVASRFHCIQALHEAGVPVQGLEILDLVENITDEELHRIFTEDDELSRAHRTLLSGNSVLQRLLAWTTGPGTDRSTGGRLAMALAGVLKNDRMGNGPAKAAEAISVLAARDTSESRFAAEHLISGLSAIAEEQKFGLGCTVTEAQVLPFIDHRSWEINLCALHALSVIGSPLSSDAADKLLALSTDALTSKRNDGFWASGVVEALGSCEDSPALRDLLRRFGNHPMGGPRSSAAEQLIRLGGLEEARPIWKRFMEQGSPYNRMYAEQLIDEFANEDDIDDVALWLSKRLRKNNTHFSPTPQAGHLISFLARHPESDAATAALASVTKRFERLAEPLQHWIRTHVPTIVPPDLP